MGSSSTRLGDDQPRTPSEQAILALRACRRADQMLDRIRAALDDSAGQETSRARLAAMEPDRAKLALAGLKSGAFGSAACSAATFAEAVHQIGLEQAVQASIAAAYLLAAAEVARGGGLPVRAFFRESLGAGAAARVLGEARGMTPRLGFVAGLMQDAGRLALAAQHGRACLEVTGGVEAEREAFGIDHTQAGLAVLIHRGYPPQVCEAAAFHHGAVEKISVSARIAAASWILATMPNPVSIKAASEWLGVSLSLACQAAAQSQEAMEGARRLVG